MKALPTTNFLPVLFPLVLAALAALLPGCSSFQTEWGQPIRAGQHAFTEGATRVEAVVRDLGPPAHLSVLPGGMVFLYEHSIVEEFQFGVSINIGFLRYIKFVRARNHLDQDVVVMTFDKEGVLRSMDSERWREKLGGGGAAQLLFSVMSLTDVASLRQRSDQHGWGRFQLQPMTVALNSGQSLRTGENGVQQRIAPNYAGQHTLEMAKPKPKKTKFKKASAQR